MSATKTTTLLDLAQNFDRYMFGCFAVPTKPIAKGFTVVGEKTFGRKPTMYWEILGVRQNGTYPCVRFGDSRHDVYDQNSTVIIHHIDNK